MANRIAVLLLSTLVAAVWICCMAEAKRRAERKEKAVYLPKYMLWIGGVCSAVFLGFSWIGAVEEESLGLTICFGVFALLGVFLILGWKNCYITYDKEGFTQKNLIGMQRSFTYDQVEAWRFNKRNPAESTIYALGKQVSFNLMSENGADFLMTVSAGYRKTHGNRNMPEMPALQKDNGGFRAHVYNPGEYLFIFILLTVFIVGMGVWLVIHDLIPVKEKDAEHYSLTFSSWEMDEDKLLLYSDQMQGAFQIGGYEDYVSEKGRLIEKCDGSTEFSVWAKQFTPKDDDPYFRVYALSSGNEVYRTFEDSSAYKRQQIPMTIAIFGAFLAIWLLFSGFLYMVGSNPQRFPKWIVYACFKKDAIDIE